jgi:hypothetical protein
MDLQQLIRNSTSDSIEDSVENGSYNSSNTAVDREEHGTNADDSIEKIGMSMSPNSKIKILKKKYLPSEMEEINEESVESDLTSSIMSKRLLQIKSNR